MKKSLPTSISILTLCLIALIVLGVSILAGPIAGLWTTQASIQGKKSQADSAKANQSVSAQTQVRPMQARAVGEDVLGPPPFLPECPHLRPDPFLNVLHQKQFGGTLLLRILVITSEIKRRQFSSHVPRR